MSVHPLHTFLALCCALAFGSVPALGQTVVAGPKSEPRKVTVTVTANATSYAKPNAARLTFVVMSQTQANIREDNDRQVAKVKKGLADLALANLDVQVVPSSINTLQVTAARQKGFVGPGGPAMAQPAQQTKQIQTLFVVTLRDKEVERLGTGVAKLSDLIVENGGMAPNDDTGPGFRTTRLAAAASESFLGPRIDWLAENSGDARRQAIKHAVKEATENARAAVGEPASLQVLSIDITTPDEHMTPRRSRLDLQADTGMIPLTVEVRVTFGY
jgi:uncharacterized protein YggE